MSRLIDIDELKGCAIIRPTTHEEIEHIRACKNLISHDDIPTAMERSTAYYNDGWIPASERLPEEIFKDYLVCLKNGAIFMAQYSTKNEFRMVCTNAIQYFYKENPVIAWQPLPEPYQPKGERV